MVSTLTKKSVMTMPDERPRKNASVLTLSM